MKATACTCQAGVYLSPDNEGDVDLNFKIKNHITNLNKIGDISMISDVFTANLKNASNFFVVKTALHPEANEDLIHEIVVGLYGTNNLRAKIPNFSYVYGWVRCSPPILNDDSKVESWCNNTEKINYIMYENIDDSVTSSKFVETCTGEEFVNIYLQLLYALKTAQKEIDFTHYDLHHTNVLIKSTKDNLLNVVKYETESGHKYIQTKHVPIIIDFGNSHIKYNGKDYGVHDLQKYSVYTDKSWIFHDLYKFLMFNMDTALKFKNVDILKYGNIIFKFFNHQEDLIKSIEDRKENFYFFPLLDKNKNLSVDDFSKYIIQETNFNFISDSRNDLPIFGKTEINSTESEVYKSIGINPETKILPPENIIDFFILDNKLKDKLSGNERLELSTKFKDSYPKTVHTINEHILSLLESIKIRMYNTLTEMLGNLDKIKTRKTFIGNLEQFVKYVHIFNYLKDRHFMLFDYDKDITGRLTEIDSIYNNIMVEFVEIQPAISNYLERLKSNYLL